MFFVLKHISYDILENIIIVVYKLFKRKNLPAKNLHISNTNVNYKTNAKFFLIFAAVRHDRMRGGRNKFGPMYKRDRARKLQVLRHHRVVPQHQMMTAGANGTLSYQPVTQPSSVASGGPQQCTMYSPPLHIKQEIQIPQVTSMTSSPDSSPSPNQLNPSQVNSCSGTGSAANIAAVLASVGGAQAGGINNGQGGQIIAQQTDPNTGGIWQITTQNQAKVC